jgi:Peptidase C13 family
MGWVKREINSLVQNVRVGVRIALFRRDALRHIRVSADQVFFLAMLDVLIVFALAWVDALPRPEFNAWGFASAGLGFAALFAVGYLFARLYRKQALIPRFVVSVYSIAPWFSLIGFAVKKGYFAWAHVPWAVGVLWWVYLLWFFAVIGWILMRLAGSRDWRVGVTLAGFIAFILSTSSMHIEFFYAGDDTDEGQQHKRVNAEEVFDAQPELLHSAARSLRAGHPGVPALYFLGFASYASQDVFKKEALYAKDLLDSRFGTRGRSLVMINHADTANNLPLASSTNLRRMLKMIGRRMNNKEDVLFVYLTSHGSEKHGLAAQFWPLSLNDIPAEKLKTYLDEAGIKWRVLLISACYSGNFVEVLKDDFTLVMTASATDRQSFGCSNTRDFTYFGEAVFKDALNRERTFIPAFQSAITAINRREASEKLEPSSPQLSIGAKIAAKLAAIERSLVPEGEWGKSQ